MSFETTGAPLISVVIPAKNERANVRACLDGIFSQSLKESLEVIVVDSGSTDGTLELLKQYPVRVCQILPTEFNHGETRNLGVRMARGEFVVLTVGDARPVDQYWIQRMFKHFRDPKVMGVCGQQVVPHDEDKNPLQWFRSYEEPIPRRISFGDATEIERMSPSEQRSIYGWDDVTAMYRRSALIALPFQRVDFMEDAIWAKDALRQGYTLVYDFNARVYHYHREDFRFRFRRKFTLLYHISRYFDHVALPTSLLPALARIVYRVSRRKYCPSRPVLWLLYNVRLEVAGWLAGWVFWFQAKLGGKRVVEKAHALLCANPPQPIRTT